MQGLIKKRLLIIGLPVLLLCALYGVRFQNLFPVRSFTQTELYGGTEGAVLKDFTLSEDGSLTAVSDDPWILLSLSEPVPVALIRIRAGAVNDGGGKLHIFETEGWHWVFGELKAGTNLYYFYDRTGQEAVRELRLDLVEVTGASCSLRDLTLNPPFLIWLLGFLAALFCSAAILLCVRLSGQLGSAVSALKDRRGLHLFLLLALSLLLALLSLEYLRVSVNSTSVVLAGVLLFAVLLAPREAADRRTAFCLGGFSVLLAVACVCGSHIVTGEEPYFAGIDESYVLPFGAGDVLGLLALSFVFYALLSALLTAAGRERVLYRRLSRLRGGALLLSKQPVAFGLPMLAMLLGWLPWLILYYPGFIFGDSVVSLLQAAGETALHNHHPVLYTLFIRLCLRIGSLLGDLTLGCAVYSVLQLLFMAYALSALVEWLSRHDLPLFATLITTAWFALSPFFGQLSISMWKDPIFGGACVLFTLALLRISEKPGAGTRSVRLLRRDLLRLLFWALVICFSRNNGIYALGFGVFGGFLLLLRVREQKRSCRRILLGLPSVMLLYGLVNGPLFAALGIGQPGLESGAGAICVNQMASVAASEDGIMSEDEAAFMAALLPPELYHETYAPCSVDRLKNSAAFDGAYLNSHVEEFLRCYVSMGLKNPEKYLQAWALMTFGYWAPNLWEYCSDGSNLVKGNLSDILSSGLDIRTVDAGNLPESFIYRIFTPYGSVLPLGTVNWILLLAVVLALLRRERRSLGVLLLSLGSSLTMMFASPYWYWPRYGTPQYFLLPLYLYLIVKLLRGEKNGTDDINALSE